MVPECHSGLLLLLLALGLCGMCQKLGAQASVNVMGGVRYRMTRGADLQPPYLAFERNVRSKMLCVGLCQSHASCKAGSYHFTRKTCCLSDAVLLNENVTYAKDDDSWYFQPAFDYEDWTLAFKADAGTNLSLLSYWELNGHHDDPEVGKRQFERGCLNADGSKICASNYRSDHLDNWDKLNIKQVSYRMYKNGENVVNVIFNGTGSTVTSWMTPSRLLQTQWPDMTPSSTNVCGINTSPNSRRYFFINFKYYGCSSDTGWVVVADYTSYAAPCDWEAHPPYPAFIYSTLDTAVLWDDAQGFADVMAIFIKF